MGFNVAPYKGERDPRSATLSRSRGVGEMDEMEELFEQLMGGEGLEDVEGLEDFDWEGLWDSFMEGEEGGQEQVQGSTYPTMFGSPIRPSGFMREQGQPSRELGMNYF